MDEDLPVWMFRDTHAPVTKFHLCSASKLNKLSQGAHWGNHTLFGGPSKWVVDVVYVFLLKQIS